MRKIFFALATAAVFTLNADAQVRMPAPSPTQTIKQDFGISSIELTYSRPGLKGRKMLGEVEKYGKMWRTGANAATKIRFNDKVELLGKTIDTGTYVLYTIPAEKGDWMVILNKGVTNWGIDGYKESEDVTKFQAFTQRGQPRTETFTMQFANLTPISTNLLLMWEDVVVTIPIKTNFTEKVAAQLKEALQSEKPPYWEAAQFYFEYGKDSKLALEMVTKAIREKNTGKPYWMAHYKAKIQKELGDKKGAIASANQSIEWAKIAKNDTYVQMNEKLLAELK